MSLLGILLGILMLVLIGKALVETIWGLVLVGFGILSGAESLLDFTSGVLAPLDAPERARRVARRKGEQ